MIVVVGRTHISRNEGHNIMSTKEKEKRHSLSVSDTYTEGQKKAGEKLIDLL